MNDQSHRDSSSGLEVVQGPSWMQSPRYPPTAQTAPPHIDDEKIPQYGGYSSWAGDGAKIFVPRPGHASVYPEAISGVHAAYQSSQWRSSDEYSSDRSEPVTQPAAAAPQRICGLRRRWAIITLLAGIVLGAVLVVGIVMGIRHANQAATSTASASLAPTPTADTQNVVTQTIALPSSTILSDCPSSNNTLYQYSANGTSYQFRKLCGVSLYNPADPTANITVATASLDDCINQCANANSPSNMVCDTVCWKNTQAYPSEGGPGKCFGYIGRNSSAPSAGGQGSLSVTAPIGNFSHTSCDSAYWINLPGT